MTKYLLFDYIKDYIERISLKVVSKKTQCLLLIIFLYFPLLSHACPNSILIYIRDDVFVDYQQFIGNKDVLAIKDFSGKTIRRDVVDMIIAQQALKLGGFDHNFKYASGKVNFRNTKMLQEGHLLISFDSYWLSDALPLKDKIYISKPVIRQGEYIAGIYTSPKNTKVLAVKKLSDLKELTAISTSKWRTDWQTLSELPLKELIDEKEWLSMARLVNIEWVDFLLMPFHSSPNQSYTMNKITLVPVKGVGIELFDSRHFVISKLHPKGEEAIKAINIGLQKLRTKGLIVNAYTQAGFFIDKNKINILNKH
ncbi:MAG: hypothetical protein MJK12_20960 [Colwellia sp.]|nr:hypothetical protein [Colwellia sp.]